MDQEPSMLPWNHTKLFLPDGRDIQAALKQTTGQRTVPNIFIGGKHIGGFDAISSLGNDELKRLVQEAKQ